MDADDVIADVCAQLKGEPVFLAGSLVAEQTYQMIDAHSDVDLFCPSEQSIIAVGQKLICNGYTLDDRFDRVWYRWLRYGFKRWHTNSLRLTSPAGVQTNLVYKLTEGHPTTSLAQVLESFDFGLLGTGYQLEDGSFRDLRPYLFPGRDVDGPLPMMPNKRDNWRNGFISQYNGIREVSRYTKYRGYGYDMSEVKDDLVTGYLSAALYLQSHPDPERNTLGQIYAAIGQHMQVDNTTHLRSFVANVQYQDSLDQIMEALE